MHAHRKKLNTKSTHFIPLVFSIPPENTEKHRFPDVFRGYRKACHFIKKEALAQTFSCEFCQIFNNTFFIEHLRRLLLSIPKILNNISIIIIITDFPISPIIFYLQSLITNILKSTNLNQ